MGGQGDWGEGVWREEGDTKAHAHNNLREPGGPARAQAWKALGGLAPGLECGVAFVCWGGGGRGVVARFYRRWRGLRGLLRVQFLITGHLHVLSPQLHTVSARSSYERAQGAGVSEGGVSEVEGVSEVGE